MRDADLLKRGDM